ncbi:hypothetical protein [Microlunatus flavus]|uniref:Uncharacterized protein n=1 Tax=Microlunatus flavus TaxID=1036181 RepID=A0A1H9LMR8_9ACTN|nr:hypothetical protein [Microlunatus flavus]SER12435.1 hypothetical protein SAMN05421756_10917 [Microlunatus flavus]
MPDTNYTRRKHPGIEDRWEDLTKAEQDARRAKGELRYRVRFTKPDGRKGSQGFETLRKAQAFQAQRRVSPEQKFEKAMRSVTVGEVMERWLAVKVQHEPNTITSYKTDVAGIVAQWGTTWRQPWTSTPFWCGLCARDQVRPYGASRSPR